MTDRPLTGARVAAPVFWGSASFVFLSFGLPIYMRELGADAVEIGGMFSVFTITMLVVRPFVGWALDRLGRRVFFIVAFVFYVVAMGAYSQAQYLAGYYLARFLQGFGASFMWVTARTIVSDVTTALSRGEEMGRLTQRSMQGSMVGGFYGFTLAGMMPMTEAWQLAFGGYAVAALVGVAIALRIPETRTRVREDSRSSEDEPHQAVVLTPELRRLMLVFAIGGFATALLDPIYLIYLQDRFELPFMQTALAFFPAGVVYALLPRHAGKLSDRYGRGPMIMTGMIAGAAVAIGLPWFPHILWVAVFYTLYAVGGALWGPAESALLGDIASETTRGRVFGYSEAATAVGASMGPLAGGLIYEQVSRELAFATSGVILLAGAALVWLWFRR